MPRSTGPATQHAPAALALDESNEDATASLRMAEATLVGLTASTSALPMAEVNVAASPAAVRCSLS